MHELLISISVVNVQNEYFVFENNETMLIGVPLRLVRVSNTQQQINPGCRSVDSSKRLWVICSWWCIICMAVVSETPGEEVTSSREPSKRKHSCRFWRGPRGVHGRVYISSILFSIFLIGRFQPDRFLLANRIVLQPLLLVLCRGLLIMQMALLT